jgi:ABC-type antimicrobial peptide transport system permease subunit
MCGRRVSTRRAGATDFGEYFVYFSFFLVVSAVVLAALFFKLGVEQRVREVGLLRAVGFGPAKIRRLFMSEALLLSAAGGLSASSARWPTRR